ncbi:PadR family transcriptional regulator [Janibacter alkaliphilus]|uniref:PadR family transcriptional regulator PadR n=1 Tax=Janibacter alkaliphilus TaxID=1069963 RepID=A0A852XEN8_9MICO|nr:PadR family transcriptional regulator [Janibacter alkaliphilus]NYG36975.1 PadR family transcriptional regulator PadR [Janibacter alkaliphilus]
MPGHDPQMLKGVLALLLLQLLEREDAYGYAVVVRLREAGITELAEGSVYPALTRMQQAGWLESYLEASGSGPARKYYRITDAGRAELTERRAAWGRLQQTVRTVLETKGSS